MDDEEQRYWCNFVLYWLTAVTTLICNYMHLYECSLKWKIHDTLSRLGSSEDTFTWVYVYDLKEIHQYDHHNTFWDRPRHLQHINSRYLKQSYDSLNGEYTGSLILEQGGVWVCEQFTFFFFFI